MATLAEIRAKLLAQENKFSNDGQKKNTNKDIAVYPHWDIPADSSVTLRFLPDDDATNDYFWRERQTIKIAFPGIKDVAGSGRFEVKVPCIEMFAGHETACPIHAELRAWYKKKDDDLSALASQYWKKKSYIMQGFVRNSPINEEEVPNSPIRRFLMSPQIHNIVRQGLLDPEMDNLPTDFSAGIDFTVNKTTKGKYADYATSRYSRRESALSESDLVAIEQFGLFNLSEFLPKQPTDVEIQAAYEMFEASVDGQLFDPDRWGQYVYYPGKNSESSESSVSSERFDTPKVERQVAETIRETVSVPVVDVVTEEVVSQPVQASVEGTSSKRAEDILSMIRNRNK